MLTSESAVKDDLLDLVKEEVENYYSKDNKKVSWAWFDYNYEREWDFYTLTTPISYKNDRESGDAIIYAEAYPLNGKYELFYLSADNEILIERRSELPTNITISFPEAETEIGNKEMTDAIIESQTTSEISEDITESIESES